MYNAFGGFIEGCAEAEGGGLYEFVRVPAGSYKVGFSIQFEGEPDDGFQTQFWKEKTTLLAANSFTVIAGQVTSGIDAHLLRKGETKKSSPVTAVLPPGTPLPAPPVRSAHVHCRKGYKLRKVKGRARCVKIHKRMRHHHRHHA